MGQAGRVFFLHIFLPPPFFSPFLNSTSLSHKLYLIILGSGQCCKLLGSLCSVSNLYPALDSGKYPAWGSPGAEGSVTGKALKATHPALLEVCQNHITWCGAATGVSRAQGQLSSLACSLCQLASGQSNSEVRERPTGEKGPGKARPKPARPMHPAFSVQG